MSFPDENSNLVSKNNEIPKKKHNNKLEVEQLGLGAKLLSSFNQLSWGRKFPESCHNSLNLENRVFHADIINIYLRGQKFRQY